MSGKVWTSRLFDASVSLYSGKHLARWNKSTCLQTVWRLFNALSWSYQPAGDMEVSSLAFLRKNQCPTASRSTESSVYMYDHERVFMLESFFCQGESEGHDEAWRSRLDMQKWLFFFNSQIVQQRTLGTEHLLRSHHVCPLAQWEWTGASLDTHSRLRMIFLRHSPQARSCNCPSIPTELL